MAFFLKCKDNKIIHRAIRYYIVISHSEKIKIGSPIDSWCRYSINRVCAWEMDSNSKLSMSLDELISAEKQHHKKRERSPRRSSYQATTRTRYPAGNKWWSTSSSYEGNGRQQEHATIKITNVPRDLTWYDLKDAFKSVGYVERCDVDNGTAWIKFSTLRDAKDAIKEYDGGDLNGRIIRVCHA